MSKQFLLLPVYWLLCNTFFFQTATLRSAPILSGSVTQNGSLYTYSYTLNNTSGPGTIFGLTIAVNSLGAVPSINPLSHTEPLGWGFGTAFGGRFPMVGEMVWGFGGSQVGVPVGQTLTGFSFTTPQPPTTSPADNYNLFCPGPCGPILDGYGEIGHVVGPADFLIPQPPPGPTPEPSFFWPESLILILIVCLRGGTCFTRRKQLGSA
jgi:hypothetical protein